MFVSSVNGIMTLPKTVNMSPWNGPYRVVDREVVRRSGWGFRIQYDRLHPITANTRFLKFPGRHRKNFGSRVLALGRKRLAETLRSSPARDRRQPPAARAATPPKRSHPSSSSSNRLPLLAGASRPPWRFQTHDRRRPDARPTRLLQEHPRSPEQTQEGAVGSIPSSPPPQPRAACVATRPSASEHRT